MVNEPSDNVGGIVPRQTSAAWWGTLVVLFVILLLGSVLVFPRYLVDRTITSERERRPSIAERLKAENDVRTTLLQGLGALVLLAGAVTTWLQLQATLARNREELRLNREGQVTERFTRATEQLGSGTLGVRLGGIYALERIAKDSPRDHGPIMEVLTAFIRERARWRGDLPPAEGTQSPKPPADIQASLTVLGRRVIDPKWREPNLDLFLADLRWAWLYKAHLKRAALVGARLERAVLIGAHLEGADLNHAHLEGAVLREAHLEGANLSGAHLEGADLSGAHLSEANLDGAVLHEANLEGALNLTKEQISSAIT
jgi:hypothetical protein